jgi:hypothetical protein
MECSWKAWLGTGAVDTRGGLVTVEAAKSTKQNKIKQNKKEQIK